MEKITLNEIAEFANGEKSGNAIVTNISIDSRKIGDNCIFIGIKGENFDGNDYIDMAIGNGAKAVITNRKIINAPYIKVSDTKEALLKMARGYKKKLKYVTTVGVTGSVGKTTTKEMIYGILSEMGKTHKTEGNLNNDLGVPLTILGINKKHDYAVVEMGMNHSGEIKLLADIAKPKISVITNIGMAHIENLGSMEAIRDAKLEILTSTEDALIVNGEQEILRDIKTNKEVWYYGIDTKEVDVNCKNLQSFDDYTTFTASYGKRDIPIRINTIGKHNVLNALAAITVGIKLEATNDQIIKGLASFAGMRQNVFTHRGYTVIEDCYNASPDSMVASLNVLRDMKGNKKIAVLGAMAELGKYEDIAHKEVFNYAKAITNEIYLYGEAWKKLDGAKVFDDKDELAKQVKIRLQRGDIALFKGSRSQKMEEVFKKVIGE